MAGFDLLEGVGDFVVASHGGPAAFLVGFDVCGEFVGCHRGVVRAEELVDRAGVVAHGVNSSLSVLVSVARVRFAQHDGQ
ncbi:MAG TPA: hypothetical protein VFQ42_15735 [Mycobacterium sp.]|nr:hypothetical protein [Mycobacterium sp.]